jgi:hypothetical protein
MFAQRVSSASTARLSPKASSVGLFAFVASLVFPALASADGQFSVDVEAVYPENEPHDDGVGFGARFGHEWDLLLLHITPEIGANYHAFGGAPDAESFAVLGGGRVGIGFIIEPSAFLHAGIGHYSYEAVDVEVSQTGLAYEMGLALDFTLLPVIDLGAHAALAGVSGDDEEDLDSFDWIALGGHITFVFDDDDDGDDDDD